MLVTLVCNEAHSALGVTLLAWDLFGRLVTSNSFVYAFIVCSCLLSLEQYDDVEGVQCFVSILTSYIRIVEADIFLVGLPIGSCFGRTMLHAQMGGVVPNDDSPAI